MIPRLRPGVRIHRDRVRDRWVLLAPERVVEIDDQAHAILARVDGTATVEVIAAALADEYEADAAEITSDAAALLGDLNHKGYVAWLR
ncbi:MAG: pyrroloquinoline quinone biosynthesis peptide chaperone PqqD [Alphaproteobacteria bacterium]|nr:pyrroloquinoline quinone biosynthesis peptide chaperone PqqD [Alphaproteobacteria bacterium]